MNIKLYFFHYNFRVAYSANISKQETSETRAYSEVFPRSNFKQNTGIYLREDGSCPGNTTSGTYMLYNYYLPIYTLSTNFEGLSVGIKEMLSFSSGEQGVFEINMWEQGISLFISGKN